MSQETLNIEYIGEKPTKRDTVCHSGIMWVGKGDVQPVPRNIAAKLLRHIDVWRLAKGDVVVPQTPVVPDPEAATDLTPLGEKLGMGNTPLTTGEPFESGEGDKGDEKAEGKSDEGGEKTTDPVSLEDILRSLPRDEEHISQRGKPIIAKVRELAGDDSITVEQVRQAWGEVNG